MKITIEFSTENDAFRAPGEIGRVLDHAARIVHDEIPKLIEKPRIQGIVSRLRDSNGDTCGQVGVEVDE